MKSKPTAVVRVPQSRGMSASLRRLAARSRAARPLAAGALLLLGLHPAQAANDAWSTMASSNLFSGQNWTTGTTTPGAATGTIANGDSLYFGTSNITTLTDDEAAGFSFSGITFNAGASAFTISGNLFALSGAITNSSSVLQTINDAFTTTGGGFSTTTGNLTLGGNITDNTTGGFSLAGAVGGGATGGGTVTLGGTDSFTATGNISINGGSTALITGATTLSSGGYIADGNNGGSNGTVTVAAGGSLTTTGSGRFIVGTFTSGTLNVNGTATFGATAPLRLGYDTGSTSSSIVNLNAGGIIGTSSNLQVDNANAGLTSNFNFNGGTLKINAAGLSLFAAPGSGILNVTTSSTASTIDANSFASAITAPIINGTTAGGLTIIDSSGTNTGVVTLNGTSTYTGGTIVNSGTLALNKGGGSGTVRGVVTVNSGATLSLTANNALGYSAGSQVTTVNINGGTVNTSANAGNEGYITSFNLTGGTLAYAGASSANNAYQFAAADATAPGITSNASATTSTISGGVAIRSGTLAYNVASGTTPSGIDLLDSGVIYGSGFGINKTGAGVLDLTGADTYTGATTIGGGTLILGGGGTLGNTAAGTGTYAGAIANSGAFVDSSTAAQTLSGVISGTGTLTQNGTGTLTLSGANTYTGATNVNAGTLNLTGSLANTAVTVGSGGTLAGFGNGTTTGTIGGSVTANGGSAIKLTTAAANSLTVAGPLTLGTAGAYNTADFTTLNYTLGAAAAEALNTAALLTANNVFVNIGNPSQAGTFTLADYSSLASGYDFSLSGTTGNVLTQTVGRNTETLTVGANALTLTIAGTPTPGVAYFDGAVGNTAWNATNSTNVNFSTNLAGTADAGNVPGAVTDVILNASNITGPISETLGAPTIINSLNVNGNGTTTLAADGNTLTINANGDSNTASDNSYTGNTAGVGINIASGANAFTVGVPLVLGNSQSYTNASGSLFTVNGTSISGSAASGSSQTLTLQNTGTGGTTLSAAIGDGSFGGTLGLVVNNTGAGVTTFTGTNTYSGATTISGGTLILGGGGTLGTGSTYAGAIANSGAFIDNSTATQTLSGVISGTGTLAQNGTGTLTLSGANTYTGGTTVNGGTLALNKGGGAGTVRGVVTVNSGATLNLTTGDAIGYNADGSQVTTLNINGGTVNNTTNGNEGYSTNVILTGGTLQSSGGGTFRFNNQTPGSFGITSNASATTSTVSTKLDAFNGPLNFNVASGTTPSGTDLLVSGVIISNSITKSGAGLLNLTGQNTFTGGVTVNAGTLNAGTSAAANNGSTALGSDAAAGRTITVGAGSTLSFTANDVFGNSAATNIPGIIVNGGTVTSTRYNIIGNINLNGATLFQNSTDGSGAQQYQGYQFSGGVTVGGTSASTISSGARNSGDQLATGGTTFTVGQTGATGPDLLVSSILTNSSTSATLATPSSLVKAGAGTMALTGANTYTGGTTINAGTIAINSASSLGASTGAATINAGTLEVTANIPNSARNFVLGSATSTVQADPGVTFTAGGVISGSGTLNKTGAGTVILMNTAANTYSGGTAVNQGVLTGNAGSYGTGAVTVASGATVDYTQGATQSAATPTATNNLSGAGTASFGGNPTAGNGTGGTVNYTGSDSAAQTNVQSGTVALANTTGSAISGPVSVATGATLTLNADHTSGSTSDQIATTAPGTANPTSVALAGGTLNANGYNDGTVADPTQLATTNVTSSMGALSLSNSSTLDFGATQGTGPFVLAFADSSSTLGTGTLNVLDYTGGTDALYIGTTNDLTPTQLSQIAFNGVFDATQLANGEIAAAPEPSQWAAFGIGLVGLGGLVLRAKKRKVNQAA